MRKTSFFQHEQQAFQNPSLVASGSRAKCFSSCQPAATAVHHRPRCDPPVCAPGRELSALQRRIHHCRGSGVRGRRGGAETNKGRNDRSARRRNAVSRGSVGSEKANTLGTASFSLSLEEGDPVD
ncbi:hypothetical protein AAFF_G00181190 [Aldrovandia affinis]|uniref:Uncharacterized protein n=1 Tax=Aldrovandia affinis TaxID=143900 RepID=A0AAD7SYF1_9TELE|nr:hypothetical protein AAFF_G00181190 [Aldrovandia affinis]